VPIQLVQKLDVEVNSWELLEPYLELAINTCLQPSEEIAIRPVTYDEAGKPDIFSLRSAKNFPVLLIAGGRKLEGERPNSYFYGYQPSKTFDMKSPAGLPYVLDIIKVELLRGHPEWRSIFRRFHGNGRVGSPAESGGEVMTGYRLVTLNTSPVCLAIYLTHIYYGR
jgi:hypothetical protein